MTLDSRAHLPSQNTLLAKAKAKFGYDAGDINYAIRCANREARVVIYIHGTFIVQASYSSLTVARNKLDCFS
jgi:hypothetical protein